MMAKSIVPLIDLVFLTLGSVLTVMTQMERVTAVPVDLTQLGQGSAVVQRGEFDVLTVTAAGMFLNDQPVTPEQIRSRIPGGAVVLRAERSLPFAEVMVIMAELRTIGCEVTVEVEETTSQY